MAGRAWCQEPQWRDFGAGSAGFQSKWLEGDEGLTWAREADLTALYLHLQLPFQLPDSLLCFPLWKVSTAIIHWPNQCHDVPRLFKFWGDFIIFLRLPAQHFPSKESTIWKTIWLQDDEFCFLMSLTREKWKWILWMQIRWRINPD